MDTIALLSDLFKERVGTLGDQNDLSDAEKARILTVFQRALANTFMGDTQIHEQLTRQSDE
jgi:hypothetical protein